MAVTPFSRTKKLRTAAAQRTFDLLHVRQFLLPFVVERLRRHRLVVHAEMPETRQRYRETAFAHAAVIPEAALVYVRMDQRVHDGHSFVLYTRATKQINVNNTKRTRQYIARYTRYTVARLTARANSSYRVEN